MNPVLASELRTRLAGWRMWALLTGYLAMLAATLYLVYESRTNDAGSPFSAPSPTTLASTGQAVFEWVVFFMLLLVLFLVPGFTSGAIAGERERQTLVPLQVTLLRPWQIAMGKLGSSVAFLGLLVVASLPLLAVSYLIGGIGIGKVVQGVLVVLFCGLAVACVTLLCSAWFRRVQLATVMSYALVLALTAGTFVAWQAWKIADEARGSDPGNPPSLLLTANPLFTAADLLRDGVGWSSSASPFNELNKTLWRSAGGPLENGGYLGEGFGPPAADGREVIGADRFGNPIFEDEESFPFWAKSSIALYVLGVLGVALAALRIRTPARVER